MTERYDIDPKAYDGLTLEGMIEQFRKEEKEVILTGRIILDYLLPAGLVTDDCLKKIEVITEKRAGGSGLTLKEWRSIWRRATRLYEDKDERPKRVSPDSRRPEPIAAEVFERIAEIARGKIDAAVSQL